MAYLDESGIDNPSPVLVYGGVLVPDTQFRLVEATVGSLVEHLIPADQVENFAEFHASQLFQGTGVFLSIDEPKRHDTIRRLLGLLSAFNLPYLYSAVDKEALARSQAITGGTEPLDAAFRMCALGIEGWMGSRDVEPEDAITGTGTVRPFVVSPEVCVLVLDNVTEKPLRQKLISSFRALRVRNRGMHPTTFTNRLWHIHDDMYFGESTMSVGIQVADLCNYFMMRRLRDHVEDEFYRLIAPHAICVKPEPEWSQNRKFFRCHDDALDASVKADG